ncbi:MAG TPA: MFS transporter, partial [Acetobacteraceae bacterium]|nr:MFS transporter [Acetobacteraceae bacterium]
GTAAWAPLIPFVKARSGLSEAALGLLLLCFGAGSIVTMPLAGALAGRFGCRVVLVAAAAVICLILPVLATVSTPLILTAAVLVFGAAIGGIDCAANIQAVIVEKASGRPMMSGFHGLFSAGGIVAAGGISALLSVGASPLIAALCATGGVAAGLVTAAPHMLTYGGEGGGSVFVIPRGIVLFIGILCFIVFLTEGAALDWSAVFLTSLRGVAPSRAGLGYAVFACTMTIGRLTGDRIVRRFGGRRVLVAGASSAAAGLALVSLVPSRVAAIAGYALVGAGCSNIVPVLYSSVGRQTATPEHVAVAAITTLGYAGILAGPAAIGFVAQATSLSVALMIVAVLLLGVAAGGGRLRV